MAKLHFSQCKCPSSSHKVIVKSSNITNLSLKATKKIFCDMKIGDHVLYLVLYILLQDIVYKSLSWKEPFYPDIFS